MSGGVIERRRIALTGERARVDLALPLDETLADVLRAHGLSERLSGIPATGTDTRLGVLDPLGYEVGATTVGDDLVEGGLYTLVDLSARATTGGARRRASAEERADHGSRWLLLVVVAVLLLAAAAGVAAIDPLLRLATALLAAAAAVVTAVVWARDERSADAPALRGVLAPAVLAFAAGTLLVPAALDGAGQLSLASGLLVAAIAAALLALLTRIRRVRAATGTVAILLVVFGAVQGFALLVHWGIADAAALSLALVPLLLRALPSAMVNLPEGAFIDYQHFMSNRWTVRGAIPEPVTEVRAEAVRAVVADSSARLAAGTVLLSVAAALFAPFVLWKPWVSDPFVASGGIALLVCTVLALLLVPRRTTSRLLRWTPRAAAVAVLVAAVAGATIGADGILTRALHADGILLLATGLLVAAVVAVALTLPVSRGASSLVWSRIGDIVEALAVALALPAALLYADVLTLLRGMMAT